MIEEQVWRVHIELAIPPDTVDSGGGIGFTNFFVWANSESDALAKVEGVAADYKWTVPSKDHVQPIDPGADHGDEWNELIDDVEKNHSHCRYATFHSYKPS